ncbi:MAG: hypothetical protein LQ352_003973 [Teloschistes flavicans]|nr:MAG: hypothetical protein LQ352_003973 [Teloschistes flavicans]
MPRELQSGTLLAVQLFLTTGSITAPLPTESDGESVVEAMPLTILTKDADEIENMDIKDRANDAEDEGDDEDEDDDGEIFVVEKILSHHDEFEDGVMRYEIKWKGYEKKADRTWETEDNLEGAREILEAYWNSIGGKPVPSNKPLVSKKRGRQSSGRASTGSRHEPATKKKKGRKSAMAIEDRDASDEPPAGHTDVNPDTWKPPSPDDNAWDPLIMSVDTIEKDAQNEMWAYLVWNEKNDDGRFNRSKARLATCNKACPQRMLQFYEKHVVFTNQKHEVVEENGIGAPDVPEDI